MRDTTQDTAPVTLNDSECLAMQIRHGDRPEWYLVADYQADEPLGWRGELVVLIVVLGWLALISVLIAAVVVVAE